ncbi:MAG TPA: DUF302 domain-containing protein [Gemmatimonadales bacterium]|nr:DUF302 domain-containing protein [Gemmatimonadales bacterium]
MTSTSDNGIVTLPSSRSVDEILERLQDRLRARGIMLLALVDHSGEAAKIGLRMPPTKLAIFGSPKAGTPLMLAAPTVAIDLPLKILIWEDSQARTWISYNSPEYLKGRHGVPPALLQNIAAAGAVAAEIA